MKTILKNISLIFVVALSLTACSSMDPDESKNSDWPVDFETSAYSAINPDIANKQRRDSVTAANKALGVSKISVTDTADMQIFLSDTVGVKALFTDYLGTDSIYWPGFTSFSEGVLYADIKSLLVSYFHTYGNTAGEDVAYLNRVKIDSTQIQYQYPLYGKAEGRAYRYCGESEKTTVQDPSQADATNGANDYSAHLYCYDESTATKYLID